MAGMPTPSAAKNSNGILFHASPEIEMHRTAPYQSMLIIQWALFGSAKRGGAEAAFSGPDPEVTSGSPLSLLGRAEELIHETPRLDRADRCSPCMAVHGERAAAALVNLWK
jgi:hypothetical protein